MQYKWLDHKLACERRGEAVCSHSERTTRSEFCGEGRARVDRGGPGAEALRSAPLVCPLLEALGIRGIEVTPLELLEAYRRLATRQRSGNLGPAEPVFLGLRQSITFGMAHAAQVETMEVAGKTGTATSRESAQTHGFFVGYAPAEKPDIAVVVFLEQGRGMDAAALAQPVFAEFSREKRSP